MYKKINFIPSVPSIKKNLARSFTIAGTMVVAVLVPNFGVFLNLIGAFFGIVIVLVGPMIFHMRIFGKAHNPK